MIVSPIPNALRCTVTDLNGEPVAKVATESGLGRHVYELSASKRCRISLRVRMLAFSRAAAFGKERSHGCRSCVCKQVSLGVTSHSPQARGDGVP